MHSKSSAQQYPESAGESAEWLNSILKRIWPILNPDLFSSLVDLLEDTMKKQSPGLIRTVRIEDHVLGSNPMRIHSVHVLPDSVEIGGAGLAEEGNFISLEVEFSYRRLPPPTAKGSNAHFIAYFGTGPKFASFEIPVIVEIRGAHGHLRLRVQLISDPPFVRHTFVCFPYTPELHVVANPLKSAIAGKRADLMNLPILSQFVEKSIKGVLATFTSPAWYSIDCSRLLVGSDVEVSPRFLTRIITDHGGNPHFEELCFIRVTPDDVEENDHVRMTVWDSDDTDADEYEIPYFSMICPDSTFFRSLVGRVDVSLAGLFKSPNVLQHREQPLAKVHRRPLPQGKLSASIGFFSLAARDLEKAMKTSNSEHLPPFLRSHPSQANSRSGLYSERIKSTLESLAPPDPELSSGILSIQIHQLEKLEIPHVRGAINKGSQKVDHLPPSTDCQLVGLSSLSLLVHYQFINDAKVLQTRIKKFSANPYINASLEVFCKDWTATDIRVVVNHHQDGGDSILGMLSASLSHLLQNRTQKTMWHSLVEGTGYGRLRMSVLFKSVAISIPPPLKGWDIGVLAIRCIRAHMVPRITPGQIEVTVNSVSLRTSDSPVIDESTSDCLWTCDPILEFPVTHRHQISVIFQVKVDGIILGESVTWLSSIPDQEATHIKLPVFDHDFARLRQNNYHPITGIVYVDPKRHHKRHRPELAPSASAYQPASIGHLDVELRFEPGIAWLHHDAPHSEGVNEIDEALRGFASSGDLRRPKSKVNFAPGTPHDSGRSAHTSQTNSRRSSWGDATNMTSEGQLDLLAHRSTDVSDSNHHLPKLPKWVKQSKKRLSRIGKGKSGKGSEDFHSSVIDGFSPITPPPGDV
ncbi:hypothetical protein HWV62_5444 [Athelia sp. TMB]|nr:hypothetical protein HWV62_5444 [Athelia sp. TMB]